MPQAAYIAGLADGEGSFILFRRPYGVGMRLTLTSTNRRVLDWLVETTGVGSIVQQRRASEKHSQCWIWQVNAQAAATVIRQIRPYLVIKPDQADLALRVQDRQGSLTPEERETALTAMRALNARGPRP